MPSLLSPSLQLQSDLLRGPRRRDSDYPLSNEALARIPYSKLGVRVGDQARIVMLLDRVDGERLSWISHDRVRFVTEQGRLVRTQGMARDLQSLVWRNGEPLTALAAQRQGERSALAELEYRREDEAGLIAHAELQVHGPARIEVFGSARDTLRIDEVFDVPAWRWKAENRYWIAPDSGIVWRSRQCYCPEIPPLELEWLAA